MYLAFPVASDRTLQCLKELVEYYDEYYDECVGEDSLSYEVIYFKDLWLYQ